ncbi:membrane protein [Cronobacter phage CR9]|uniref:Uncharacterized protein n=1 Tax=Cronobacter phage CR9 TaxID=1162290 RepID=M1F2A0_9CAUD|nr:membrane protein [Cronobacter phage CR9]AFH21014.1 hypothetical protein CR9_130 [Cronobacter phage CR9]
MGMIIFVALWVLFSAYSLWRIIVLMSINGKVNGDDRFMVLLAMTPASYLFAPCIALVEFCFFLDKRWKKFKQRPDYISWSLQRKIRKRWRGPLVRIVEHLHNKRKEKAREENLPEV